MTSQSQMTDYIQQWTDELLGAPANIEITELPCPDGNCPLPYLTIVINGNSHLLHKPLIYIRKWDIKSLLSQQK